MNVVNYKEEYIKLTKKYNHLVSKTKVLNKSYKTLKVKDSIPEDIQFEKYVNEKLGILKIKLEKEDTSDSLIEDIERLKILELTPYIKLSKKSIKLESRVFNLTRALRLKEARVSKIYKLKNFTDDENKRHLKDIKNKKKIEKEIEKLKPQSYYYHFGSISSMLIIGSILFIVAYLNQSANAATNKEIYRVLGLIFFTMIPMGIIGGNVMKKVREIQIKEIKNHFKI